MSNSTENCVMCGKSHTGKYYVCDACISEYNFTKDQILEMGGLRDTSESTNNTNNTNNRIYTKNDPQRPVSKRPDASNVLKRKDTDEYIYYLRRIHNNISTIRTIMVVMFTLFIIAAVFILLGYASSYSA